MKHLTDLFFGGITLATLLQFLPAIASLLSIAWLILRLIEMFTGKTIAALVRGKHCDCHSTPRKLGD